MLRRQTAGSGLGHFLMHSDFWLVAYVLGNPLSSLFKWAIIQIPQAHDIKEKIVCEGI